MIEIEKEQLAYLFRRFQDTCKFCKLGFVKGFVTDTCRKKENIPKGDSWGECSFSKCPLLKVLKDV